MKVQKFFRKLLSPVTGLILVFTLSLAPVIGPNTAPSNTTSDPVFLENPLFKTAYADPITPEDTTDTANDNTNPSANPTDDTTTPNNDNDTEDTEDDEPKTCYDQVEGLGWLVCPTTGLLANVIDSLYGIIEDFLTISPLESNETSPIYLVWQYARDITNIVFVIFLLIIVWSQLTGLGISNYGIKKTLPRIIIAAILVNLSYLICTLAVDVSNILGVSIKNFLTNIAANASGTVGIDFSFVDLFSAVVAGGTIAGVTIALTGGLGHFLWMFLGAVLAGVISVVIGFITIAMRQAVISILVMISPLAFVCYLLPNTEKWFEKWKKALTSMLVFYPMFAGLFGASQLAGWAIMASSNGNAFFVILGAAVRILPLFMAGSLMKMSGTVLAGVGAGLNKLVDPARRGVRGWSNSYADMHKQRYIANSVMPAAGLRRYLDAQARKRALNIKSNTESRLAQAETTAQRLITTGGEAYDPGNPNQKLKTSVFTRDAKSAMNRSLEAQTTALDSQHILGNYATYHNKSLQDVQLNSTGGANFLDYTRAELAATNDSYADVDWLMGKYDSFRKLGAGNYNFDRYITGGAGALGHMGDNTVLGQVISKASANEAKRRSATALVYAKWGYNKGAARDMIVGYYVDDDGIATYAPDAQGRREKVKINDRGEIDQINGHAESSPGEFLKYHPEVLQGYDKFELASDGKGGVKKRYYFETKDQDGKAVTRIYKDDGPAMKETLANWDMTIQDPIDGLYGILSGIKEGDIKVDGLEGVGLARLSTTLGRAMMSTKFSEKASFAGPMYATSVSNRYIQDFVHQNIARLDNLIKTGKPSKFNTQDFAELEQLRMLMNPDNWERMLFNDDSLRSYRNVNGKVLNGTRILRDDHGNILRDNDGKIKTIEIPYEQATKEDFQNTIIVKFLNPASTRFATMMSRITPNTLDNQKPGVAKSWVGLLETMKGWQDPKNDFAKLYPLLGNPVAPQKDSDIIVAAQNLRRELIPNHGQPGNGRNGIVNSVPGGGPVNPTGSNPFSAGAPAAGQRYNNGTAPVDYNSLRARFDEAQARREARGGADPIYTDEQRAAEDANLREIDAEYIRENRQSLGDLDPSENPNLQVRLDDLVYSCVDGEQFYESAMEMLQDELANDQTGQLQGIIAQFEQFHETNYGAELETYRTELENLLSLYFGSL